MVRGCFGRRSFNCILNGRLAQNQRGMPEFVRGEKLYKGRPPQLAGGTRAAEMGSDCAILRRAFPAAVCRRLFMFALV